MRNGLPLFNLWFVFAFGHLFYGTIVGLQGVIQVGFEVFNGRRVHPTLAVLETSLRLSSLNVLS